MPDKKLKALTGFVDNFPRPITIASLNEVWLNGAWLDGVTCLLCEGCVFNSKKYSCGLMHPEKYVDILLGHSLITKAEVLAMELDGAVK